MRLQRLASAGEPYRVDGLPYGLPYRSAGRPPQPLMHGVVEHIYESPDVVRRDAFPDEHYTSTTAAERPGDHHHHHQQQQQPVAQSPHHGYWPLPDTSHPEPTSPATQCCGSTAKSSFKAKSTGNYSL